MNVRIFPMLISRSGKGLERLLLLFLGVRPFILFPILLGAVISARAHAGETVALGDRFRANDAVAQLVRTQLPSGFFPYDFNFSTGDQSDMNNMDGANLVRQTGTAWSVSQYLAVSPRDVTRHSLEYFLKRTSDDSISIGKGTLQKLLERVGLYNRWQLWRPLREPLNALGMLYSKEGKGQLVSTVGDYERALPGATALSLLTAINYLHDTGDTQFNPVIEGWTNGLIALSVPGRGFREAPHYLTESAYVNGQAWLALGKYVESFPADKGTLVFLEQLDDYLLKTYSEKPNRLFYSWGIMAASVREKSTRDPRLVAFMIQLTTLYLEKENKPIKEEKKPLEETNSCASVEGLATFVGTMKAQGRENEPIVLQVVDTIKRLMTVNRKLQIGDHPTGNLNVEAKFSSKLHDYRGAFLLSLQDPLMQIDLTAHCISALVRMDQAGLY